MRVEAVAGAAMRVMIEVYNGEHLVDIGDCTEIVFVPQHDDGVVPFLPRRRGVNGANKRSQRLVSDKDQCRIQARLHAGIAGVEVALRSCIAAPVLVMALVWRNPGKLWHAPGLEVVEQSALTFKTHDILQTRTCGHALLNALEIHERI